MLQKISKNKDPEDAMMGLEGNLNRWDETLFETQLNPDDAIEVMKLLYHIERQHRATKA